MTANTLEIPVNVVRRTPPHVQFKSVRSTTTVSPIENAEVPDREALIEKLIALTMSDNSLDWDTLARIDIEGWGADSLSE